MLTYMKSVVWDWVLCIVASSALAYTVCSGFYSTQPYQNATGILLTVGISLLVTTVLFAISWSTRTLVFGSIATAVCIAAALVVSVRMSTVATALEDAPGNYLYYAFAALIPPVLVFVLSRRKTTTVVLAIVGTLLCAAIEYLYWYGHVVAFVIFLICVFALFVFRTYQSSLINSESEHFAFNSITAAGTALALASALLGAGLFMLVLAPLNPPNVIVKLLTQEFRIEEHEVKGTSSSYTILDGSLFSNTMSNQVVETSSINDAQTNDQTNNSNNQNNSAAQEAAGTSLSLGNQTDNDNGDGGLKMEVPSWLPFAIAGLVLLLAIGAILLKRLLRARRFAAMTAGGNSHCVRSLYLFFLERFKRMKMPEVQTYTLLEYAKAFQSTFSDFEKNAMTPTFAQLTEVYSNNVYGGVEPDDASCALFKDYYKTFYKKACGYVGRLKYCLMYFFI